MIGPPQWVLDLADAFWQLAGSPQPQPGALRQAIARALPLAIVFLPNLSLRAVRERLQRCHVKLLEQESDRPLRGCLFVGNEIGFIFVDGTDPDDEQRFSTAHELSHYLRDYWQPRCLAIKYLGEGIKEVFDGLRPATPSERIHAILQRVPLGYHAHLMHRVDDDLPLEIAASEDEADRLAFELLAPAQAVWQKLGNDCSSSQLIGLLRNTFGLPARQAHDYAALLKPTVTHPLLELLG